MNIHHSNPFDFQNNSFDFIRLMLAIIVVIGHSSLIGRFGFDIQVPMRDYYSQFTNLGTFAVYGFFVISGFLVCRSWTLSKSLLDFAEKRARRILPGFIAALAITAFVFIPVLYFVQNQFEFVSIPNDIVRNMTQYFFSNFLIEMCTPKIPNLLLLDNGFNLDVNGPLWTLIHEVRAYFLVGLLGWLGIFNRSHILISLAIVANVLYSICSLNVGINIGEKYFVFKDIINNFVGDYRVLILFTYFIFGMGFYVFHSKIIWNKWVFALSILGLLIGWKFDIFPILAPTCLTYFVLYSSQIIPTGNFSTKFGDLSYGIYIYSWPIQLCLFYLGWSRITGSLAIDYILYVLLSIIVAGFAGFLSWNLVEKNWIKKSIPKP